MTDLTVGSIQQLSNNYGGGVNIDGGYNYLKLKKENEIKVTSAKLAKTGCKVRLKSGDMVDTYVILEQDT